MVSCRAHCDAKPILLYAGCSACFPTLSADVCMRRVCSALCEKEKDTLISFEGLACGIGKLVLLLVLRAKQYESLSLCAFRCIRREN